MTEHIYRMYTDGSYNVNTKTYSGAYYVENLLEGTVTGEDPEFVSARNVAGECIAVVHGIKSLITKAKLIPNDKIIIYHDYTGLSEWANGTWKAKKPISQKYVKAIQTFRDKGLIIEFHKVSAHTGVVANEIVDKLAKKAIGLI